MIQTPVKKSWKNHPQPILCNIVSNLSNLYFSFVAREPVQTTSQSPNINPWKFQTILENQVFLWKNGRWPSKKCRKITKNHGKQKSCASKCWSISMRYEALSPSPARAMTQTVPRKYIYFYRVVDGVIDGVRGTRGAQLGEPGSAT